MSGSNAAAHEAVKLPYDGTPVGAVPQADTGAVDRAVAAARKALAQMREMGNCDRADLLLGIADLLKRDVAEYAQLICAETGKPAKEARVEAERSHSTLLAAAHEARQLHGEVVPMDFAPTGKGRMAVTVREPLGVIGCITPFNFPLNLALHKVAPALAAGNAVVHKPATKTPLSAARLARTMEEAGAPKGAYNLITGSGARLGMAMAEHPGIAMLTFTGSAEVGRIIKSRAGFKKVTLELGNNGAVIVEPEADLATVAARTTQGAFAHSGQVCISVQRVFAHRSIAGELVERLKAAAEALKIGHPYEETTDISSLIDEGEAIRIEQWIAEARAGGAKVVTGGTRQFATIRAGGAGGRSRRLPHLLPGSVRPSGRGLPLRQPGRRHRARQRHALWTAGGHLHQRYPARVPCRAAAGGGRRDDQRHPHVPGRPHALRRREGKRDRQGRAALRHRRDDGDEADLLEGVTGARGI